MIAREKWIKEEYGESPVPQLFLDSFDSGFKAGYEAALLDSEEKCRKLHKALERALAVMQEVELHERRTFFTHTKEEMIEALSGKG